jgi:hypothetical protein
VVERVLAELEAMGQGRPTSIVGEAQAYHEHLIRKMMIQMGYDTGEVVRATSSVVVRSCDGDRITWAADLPPAVQARIRRLQ